MSRYVKFENGRDVTNGNVMFGDEKCEDNFCQEMIGRDLMLL